MKQSIVTIFILLYSMLIGCHSETEQNTDKAKVTVEDVEAGIRANIAEKVKEGDGYFSFSKDTIDLRLRLVRVHTEYLSILGPNEYFACVDLATESGDVYDVDFFLKGTPGSMEITKTDVHKRNGKPYYTWKQNKANKSWYTVPVKNADNSLLGVIEGEDEFEFFYEVQLPEFDKTSEIWIPIAKTDQFQEIEIIEIVAPKGHKISKEGKNSNRILYSRLLPESSGEILKVHYRVKRKEKGAYSEQGLFSGAFLESTPLLPVGDRFSEIADSVISSKEATTDLDKAKALYEYVVDNVRYAKQGKYGTGDANYACDSKSGNCTEFHSLFISLARSSGIPARFAIGAAIPSERNDGGVNGYHCWAEFFADDKWWPVDISEANKYAALSNYYFGHHPANRIELSRGRNILPNPAPRTGPISFFAYPLLEINGEAKPVKTKFSFSRPNS